MANRSNVKNANFRNKIRNSSSALIVVLGICILAGSVFLYVVFTQTRSNLSGSEMLTAVPQIVENTSTSPSPSNTDSWTTYATNPNVFPLTFVYPSSYWANGNDNGSMGFEFGAGDPKTYGSNDYGAHINAYYRSSKDVPNLGTFDQQIQSAKGTISKDAQTHEEIFHQNGMRVWKITVTNPANIGGVRFMEALFETPKGVVLFELTGRTQNYAAQTEIDMQKFEKVLDSVQLNK